MSKPASEALAKVFSSINKQTKKGENFLDVCFGLPERGVGHRLTKKVWPSRSSYWTVTKVKFSENSGGRTTSLRGNAYGVLTWNGVTEMKERRVIDLLEKNWTTFPYTIPKKTEKPINNEEESTETTEQSSEQQQ
ncbi:hypothetical protein PPL_07747 [Heterostelium album PN500]|uniref:Uncharacterized protein n=1 Tax=Heterostelium pallidum (strain ATCC 26659 / Pp 5 / PN500) TaxID=670386 RepID=D3BGU5_HETP5|nr:hypothetical protein PPL_07747 [Heterostelium album PN500]EFA79329.1 hypothetical protein PPL_07747 [Heterostelium album PN500]|eukprot:XP_020431450.1 hypothetical protein PPL_07747 [Heterostelium album PN500]